MKAAVAGKMPKRLLAKMKITSGPRSSASLTSGLSLGFPGIVMLHPWRRRASCGGPRDRGGEILRREGAEIVDAFADADEVHRDAVLGGDRHQDAAARGAVELGHHQAGHVRGAGE